MPGILESPLLAGALYQPQEPRGILASVLRAAEAANARNAAAAPGGMWGPTFDAADQRGTMQRLSDAVLGLGSSQVWRDYAARQAKALEYSPELVDNLLNVITPMGIGSMLPKEFYGNFYKHIDLKGRKTGTSAENAEKIMREGFSSGYVNALPIFEGAPSNFIEKAYAPQKGDYVYLVPKSAIKSTGNGPKIQSGWKPTPEQIVKIDDPSKSLFDYYSEALNKK